MTLPWSARLCTAGERGACPALRRLTFSSSSWCASSDAFAACSSSLGFLARFISPRGSGSSLRRLGGARWRLME